MARIERALRAAGYGTLNLDYDARHKPLETLAGEVAREAGRFLYAAPDPGAGPLHVVAHSMGGLLARALITRRRPAGLGRVVMLGTPNGGSEVADLLCRNALYRRVFGPAGAQLVTCPDTALRAVLGTVDYPLGVIAGDRSLDPISSWLLLPGPDDGRVSVERTKVAGMADHIVLHATHPLMMRNAEVIRQTLHFLRHGRFEHAAEPPAV